MFMPRSTPPDVAALLPLPPAVFHILVSLAAREAHGYAIMQEVAERAGVRLGPGTLYTAIRRLLEDGLVAECRSTRDDDRDDPRRRYYRLTAYGRAAARAEAARLNDLVRQARTLGLA
jgi:DNA-binding PadR family transcriptional regulator